MSTDGPTYAGCGCSVYAGHTCGKETAFQPIQRDDHQRESQPGRRADVPGGVIVDVRVSGESGNDYIDGGMRSNAPNPKQAMGDRKIKIGLVPASAVIAAARAFQYGAFMAPRNDGLMGYGPYNWRETKIEAMTYVHAALRHIYDWLDGEECADDSKAPHLGHAIASLAILIDAAECDTLLDNRPMKGK